MRFVPYIVALISCTPDPEGGDDKDGEEETSSLQGTSTRTVVIDGVEVCTESHELTGTPYTGDCPDCRFAFEITTSNPQVNGQCMPNPRMTWAEDNLHQDLRLALTESDQVLWGTTSPTSTYYGGTVPPEDWEPVGEGSWDGAVLTMESQLRAEMYEYTPGLFEECGEYDYPVLSSIGPTNDTPGTVPCDMAALDAWEIEATEGAVISAWVDNLPDTAPEETLIPIMALTDAEACMLAVGAPSFPCASSIGPQPMQCPGLEFVAPATGTYRVLVASQWEEPCPDGSGGYVLRGNLDGTPLTFTQTLDDAVVGQLVVIEEQASLVAQVEL